VVVKDNIVKTHSQLDAFRRLSLLPLIIVVFAPSSPNLDASHDSSVVGSRGGLLTAWCFDFFSLARRESSAFIIMVVLQSTTSDVHFAVTNVYGPADHALTDQFLSDLHDVATTSTDPWFLIGDFNLTRAPSNKNTPSFNACLASRFIQAIDAL